MERGDVRMAKAAAVAVSVWRSGLVIIEMSLLWWAARDVVVLCDGVLCCSRFDDGGVENAVLPMNSDKNWRRLACVFMMVMLLLRCSGVEASKRRTTVTWKPLLAKYQTHRLWRSMRGELNDANTLLLQLLLTICPILTPFTSFLVIST